MKSDIKLGIVFLVIISGGLWAYYLYAGSGSKSEMVQSPKPTTAPGQTSTEAKGESPAFPVPPEQNTTGVGGASGNKSLPKLKDSDPIIGQELLKLFGEKIWTDLFQNQDFIRSVVITVESLNQPRLAHRFLPIIPPAEEFLATKGDKSINPKNYFRYEKYIALADTLDLNQLVNLYIKYYPLFQQASEENEPKKYFNDELVRTLDRLIATPEPEEPIAITKGIVSYKYVDPKLESLSSGQKILLRIGPKNRARMKVTLINLRNKLAHLPLGK